MTEAIETVPVNRVMGDIDDGYEKVSVPGRGLEYLEDMMDDLSRAGDRARGSRRLELQERHDSAYVEFLLAIGNIEGAKLVFDVDVWDLDKPVEVIRPH